MSIKGFLMSLLLVPILLLALACGGDDSGDSSSPQGSNSPAAGPNGDDSSGDGDSPGDADSGNGDAGGTIDLTSEDCLNLIGTMSNLSGGALAPTVGGGLELTSEYFEQLIASSPGPIQDDMRTFGEAMIGYFNVLEDLGVLENPALFATLSEEDQQRIQGAASAIDAVEVQDSIENISNYLEAACSE